MTAGGMRVTPHRWRRAAGTVLASGLAGAAAFALLAMVLRSMGSQCGILCQPEVAGLLGLLAGLLGGVSAEMDG